MHFLVLFLAITLPQFSFAAKEKKRAPSSTGQVCLNVKSIEVNAGRILLNEEYDLFYTTTTGIEVALQTVNTALITNNTNDLCISAEQDSLNAKRITAKWPALAIKPRR